MANDTMGPRELSARRDPRVGRHSVEVDDATLAALRRIKQQSGMCIRVIVRAAVGEYAGNRQAEQRRLKEWGSAGL